MMDFKGMSDASLVALAIVTVQRSEEEWKPLLLNGEARKNACNVLNPELYWIYEDIDAELRRRGITNEYYWIRVNGRSKPRPTVLGLWFEKGDGWTKFYLEEGSGSADLEITAEKLRTIKDRIHNMLDKTGKVAWNIAHTSSVAIRILPFTEGKGVEVVVGCQRYTADEALHIINTVLNYNDGDND